MRANRLQNALNNLSVALREAEAALEEMRAEFDPLAVHIFVSRRQYRNTPDSKGWQTACDLGFRGSLGEWARLMGAGRPRVQPRGQNSTITGLKARDRPGEWSSCMATGSRRAADKGLQLVLCSFPAQVSYLAVRCLKCFFQFCDNTTPCGDEVFRCGHVPF